MAEKSALEQADVARMGRKPSPQMRDCVGDLCAVKQVTAHVENLSQMRWTNVMEIAYGLHAIPSPEAPDRILRYEAAAERSRIRAIEQLDRLQ